MFTMALLLYVNYLQLSNCLEHIVNFSIYYQDLNAYCTQVYVILKVKATLGWLKILSNHSENRTCDIRNASPALYRLSYVVRTVRYCDISELALVLSLPDSSKCIISRCKCILYSCVYDKVLL